MSTPIVTTILDEVEARLGNITVENGYFTDVNKIQRARLSPFASGDIPAINYWPVTDKKVNSGMGWEERALTLFIEYHDMTRDRPFSDVSEELAADVWIALWRSTDAPAVSDTPSIHLGGLVSGVSLEASSPEIGEGQTPFCGVLLEISITYKRQPNDPFTIVT